MMDLETWAYIRHLSRAQKLPIAVIARKLGLDRKTVRKAVLQKSMMDKTRKTRASLLDPFRDDIRHLLDQYPDLSAVRILEEIRNKGYQGKITILRDYLKKLRASGKEPYFKLSVPAGLQAQVDWGYCGQVRMGTTNLPLYCFALVLSYSRALHLEFTVTMSQETFLEAHVRGFHYFQGCPKEILYDNLSSVVLSRVGSNVRFNPRFLDFAGYFGFQPRVCNVRKPREKGRVEMSIKYIKQNFLAGRTFSSLEDVRHQSSVWRDTIANRRIHRSTRQRPIDLLHIERTTLLTLPESAYDTSLKQTLICPAHAFVTFQTNEYSVPFSCVGKTLLFKADMQYIRIFQNMTLVAEHRRCYDRHQRIENRDHRKELLSQRSRATFSKAYEELCAYSSECKAYLEGLNGCEGNMKNQVRRIFNLSRIYGKTELRQAIIQALAYDAYGADYIENIIVNNRRKRHTNHQPGPIVITSRPELASLTVVPHDMRSYETNKEEEQRDDPTTNTE
jgi:transposase